MKEASMNRVFDGRHIQDNKRQMPSYYPHDIRNSHRIIRHGGISNHVYGATDFSNEILNLRTAHVHLSDAIYLLNQIFGLQLLLSVSSCICCFLLNFNYEIYGYFSKDIYKIPFGAVIRGAALFLRFISMVLVASHTCYEAKHAGKLIISMEDRCLSKDTREELKIFTTHIHSYKFEFNACGLFKLNLGLVMSAIATGTTYLVILLQFAPMDGLKIMDKA